MPTVSPEGTQESCPPPGTGSDSVSRATQYLPHHKQQCRQKLPEVCNQHMVSLGVPGAKPTGPRVREDDVQRGDGCVLDCWTELGLSCGLPPH